jgi:histidyl-tRNA synthetase
VFKSVVSYSLNQIAQRHGCERISTPFAQYFASTSNVSTVPVPATLSSSASTSSNNPTSSALSRSGCVLIDGSGQLVQLRYSLRSPFLALVAAERQHQQRQLSKNRASRDVGDTHLLYHTLRRYDVSDVFRAPSSSSSSRPVIGVRQFDIDIVTPSQDILTGDVLLNDCEILVMVSEFFSSLPFVHGSSDQGGGSGAVTIRISHTQLLRQIVTYLLSVDSLTCSLAMHNTIAFQNAIQNALHCLFVEARRMNWPQTRKRLAEIASLSSKSLDCLELIMSYKGAGGALDHVTFISATLSNWAAQQYNIRRIVTPANEASLSTLFELTTLLDDLAQLGVVLKEPHQLVLDPSLAPHSHELNGPVFHVTLAVPFRDPGTIAVGGRYASDQGESCPVMCSGISIAVDTIAECWLAVESASSAVKRTPTSTQVLVCSIGRDMAHTRIRIARELWRTQVSAEYMYGDDPSMSDQLQYANAKGIPWLVIAHAKTFRDTGIVKVRNLDVSGSKVEDEVPAADLGRYFSFLPRV